MSNKEVKFKNIVAGPSFFASSLLSIIKEGNIDKDKVISILELWMELNPDKWEDLNGDAQKVYIDMAKDALKDTLICTRVWEAWFYGTMSKDDFKDACCCDDRIEEVAEQLYNTINFKKEKDNE